MAGNVQSEMSTRIAIDTISAVGSLKGFKDAISSATSAWKANEVALKSSGDTFGSLKTKVDGLNQVIDLQKSKIAELKSRQEGLDTSTKNGAESYLKLQKQIDSATKQISSLESQQERAKQSMTYYSSGLADLQKGYQAAASYSKSYVERLQAEGKGEEANKAKMSGLKSALSNLSEQYSKQEEELKRVASESGATSDAYLKQKTRLNETATAMAKTKSEMNGLNESLNKKPTNFLSGVGSKLSSVNEKASKTSDLFWKITGAHLLATGITNALTSIQAHFSTLIDSAKEYDVDQQKLIATWTTLTGSADKAKDMQDTINNLAIKTGQATDTVNELEQGFYHLHSSKTESDELTKSMLNMSDAVGLNSQQIQAVTQDMVNGLSRGKANAGMLNQISQYFPMFREQLAKYETQVNHGKEVTVADLTTMAKQGKISSQAIETVFNQLGSGKYDKAADNMLQTMYGMERTIKSRMPALLGEIYEPIMQMKNPLIGQISKWTTSDDTKKAFSGVGQALAMQISDIMSAFGGKKLNISSNLDDLLLRLQTGIDKLGGSIVAHKKDIKDFIGSVKTGSTTSWKIFVQVLKDLEPVLKIVGGLAETYPKQFAAFAASGIILSKSIGPLSTAFKILGATWETLKFPFNIFRDIKTEGTPLNKVATTIGHSFKLIGSFASAGLKGATSVLSEFGGKIKQQAGLIGKSLKWTAKASVSVAKKSISGLWSITKSAGKMIGNGLKWTAKVAVSGAKLALTGLLKTAQLVSTGFKAAFAFMAANPFVAIAIGIAALIAGFVELYKHNAKFRAFVNGLVKSAQDFFKGITKWFGQAWSSMKKGASDAWTNTKKAFSDGWNNTKKVTQAGADFVVKKWNSFKTSVVNIAKSLWQGILNIWNAYYNFTISVDTKLRDAIVAIWNAIKNSVLAIVKGLWNGIKEVFTTLKDWSIDIFNGLKTGVVNIWNGLKKSVSDVANGIWNGVKSIFTTMYDWLNKITGGRLGDVLNIFKSIFGSISGVISGAVKNVKHAFGDIVRGILSPFNDMLSGLEKGINWVLDKVGATKIKGTWHIDVPSYATGTKGGVLHDQLALVNDAKGSKYREMYHTPDGQIGMFPAQRNMLVPLKAGTEILDAENSAKLAKLMGLNNYASGSIGSFFGGLWNKGKDLLEDADKIIAHPIQFLESVFSKFTNGIKASTGLATDIISNFPSTIAKSAVNWIKNLFSEDAGGSSANPSGSGVQRWKDDVIKALKANGLSSSSDMVAKVLRQISTESGGNPSAKQPGADPDGDGSGPALGLMQTKRSTFNAYKFSGHGSIFNGYDNLLAALKYAKARYGSSLSFLGNGHGYANGGIVSTEGLYRLAEGNKSEYIIPTDYSKHDRAVQLLDNAKRAVMGSGLDDSAAEKLDMLVEQNNTLISILNTMLSKTMSVSFNGKMIGELYPEFDKQGYNSNAYQQRNVWG